MTDPSANRSLANGGSSSSSGDVAAQFKIKSTLMKSWKAASPPSNRDRLELYALHKQAVHGEAPESSSVSVNGLAAADRAKYQAWRSKAGISKPEAMRLYVTEADRQVRVYGTAANTPRNGVVDASQAAAAGSTNASSFDTQSQQPRGLAAIPLLCAAASESRHAYLRRLQHTTQAWWRRQEPLTATPGTVWSWPEQVLLSLAAATEFVSLQPDGIWILPAPVVQSFFWPLHNLLLSLWMGLILVLTAWTAVDTLGQTVLMGSRRTGYSLQAVWKDQVVQSSRAASTLTQAHQPLTARMVGLGLLPYSLLATLLSTLFGTGTTSSQQNTVVLAVFYVMAMMGTAWYWFLTLPWLGTCLVGAALVAGNCFALIEAAGV